MYLGRAEHAQKYTLHVIQTVAWRISLVRKEEIWWPIKLVLTFCTGILYVELVKSLGQLIELRLWYLSSHKDL